MNNPDCSTSEAAHEEPCSLTRRLKSAFVRSIPISGVIAILVFFAIYYRDMQCNTLLLPAFRIADTLAEELRNEAGNLALDQSEGGLIWTVSYREAQRDHSDLVSKSRIMDVLDHRDLSFVRAAFEEGGFASTELRGFLQRLQREGGSEAESKAIIQEAAELFASLREELLERVQSDTRQPRLFRRDPEVITELHQVADEELDRFERKVAELKREAGWESADRPICRDLSSDRDHRDKMIHLSEETCRTSRVAYVLIYATLADRGDRESVRARFINAQQDAYWITFALSEHSSLKGTELDRVQTTLSRYAKSMLRRLSSLRAVRASRIARRATTGRSAQRT